LHGEPKKEKGRKEKEKGSLYPNSEETSALPATFPIKLGSSMEHKAPLEY